MKLGRNGKALLLVQAIVVATVAGAALVYFSYKVVPPNHVGIRYSPFWGRIDQSRTYAPGRHFIGLTHQFHLYPTTVDAFVFEYKESEISPEECTDCVWTRSTDGLLVIIEAWVHYILQSDQILEIFQHYGTYTQLRDRMYQLVRTTINDVISSHSGIFIYSNRTRVEEEIFGEMQIRLTDYYADVVALGLRSIDFPEEFEQAQLRKRVAQEDIETSEYQRQQALIEAQTKVINAEAQANITLIQAQAEAQAAFAVREQMGMSNAEYLQWLYLQKLGQLENPQIVIVTGDEVPEFLIPLEEPKGPE